MSGRSVVLATLLLCVVTLGADTKVARAGQSHGLASSAELTRAQGLTVSECVPGARAQQINFTRSKILTPVGCVDGNCNARTASPQDGCEPVHSVHCYVGAARQPACNGPWPRGPHAARAAQPCMTQGWLESPNHEFINSAS
jgi:hypothetical protein